MKLFNFIILLITTTSITGFAQLKPVQYNDGTQLLIGFEINPQKANTANPGVLILPAWMGIDTLSKDTAKKLSNMGYYAFVADVYGEGNYPKNYDDAGKMAGYYKKNIIEYHKRISLALEQLIQSGANPDNIIVIGYCFGGTGALEAARANMGVKAVVSFHGGLGKDTSRTINPIKAKILVLHGADDPYESKEEIASFQQEMRDSKADWQMIYYSNAVHSFTNPEAGNDNSKGAAYNENASKRSWQHFKLFLDEIFYK